MNDTTNNTRLAGKHILITGGAQEIRDDGGIATHVKLDVTSEEEAAAAVAHTVKEFGSINVLLNNAGINKPLFFLDVTRENWQRIMDVNAWGTLNCMRAAAKSLIEHNITVNGYGPGVVRTELWEQLDKDLVEMGMFEKRGESMDSIAENMILMKRYSYPEDIVGTAAFLASPDSDYMTGQLLMIDGGMVIQ